MLHCCRLLQNKQSGSNSYCSFFFFFILQGLGTVLANTQQLQCNARVKKMENIFLQIIMAAQPSVFDRSSMALDMWSALFLCALLIIAFPVRGYALEKKEGNRKKTLEKERSLCVEVKQVPYPCGCIEKSAGLFTYNLAMATFLKDNDLTGKDLESELLNVIEFPLKGASQQANIRIKQKDYSFFLVPDSIDKELSYIFCGNIGPARKDEDAALILLYIDNYDEVVRNTAVKDQPSVSAEIDSTIYKWCSENEVYVKKTSEDKYLGLISKCRLAMCQADQFSILERIRAVDKGNRTQPTLSIGISIGDQSALELGENAESAMEIAVSRGGDQAVIKKGGELQYYGARLNLNRRRSSIKARTAARQIIEAIKSANKVIVMGHKAPDLDSLGSAIAMSVLVKRKDKYVRIVTEEDDLWIGRLSDKLIPKNVVQGLFISPEEAMDVMDQNTLLIVVDTNRPQLVLATDLLESASRLAVVDHHRRVSDTIAQAEILYVDPYVSSTTELVVEFFQYEDDPVVLDEWEATIMLAGIALDTKNFTVSTGAGTFEIAAYLRKEGADPLLVRDMMRDDLSTFILRAEIMHNIEIYRDNIALGSCRESIVNAAELAALSADQMLNIRGVGASFVLCRYPEGIWVSARSLGDINVQNILEKLGGGGHMMGAAAQLADVSVEEAKAKLIAAIDEYFTGRG
jgi:cyclic-di-AMP phosphodiesterase